ncbi:uncharacterized protein LOC106637445 [Copidosoma floridanum]|uniref:uncharacterized protein LOC106637445 n=1 Tax=Copidosoma floridanum TaxID=29053 RepID=UPI000C6F5E73|nr:uncharacterized protein LOC106637445 [Copidosoma floridanum]
MGWALGGFGVIVLLVLAAVAAFVYYRRYSVGWQCGPRDVWIVCEEWRRKLAWLWAPREEKVGLVKAQHPTAQAVPGLYRQSSENSAQSMMHSDSDLRLDAQGAFTRFEAVDRDLHPPISNAVQAPGTNDSTSIPEQQQSIPPQPLRPAPQQPRATPRPRPSPLRAPNTIDHLRLRECDSSPLTPPPPALPTALGRLGRSAPTVSAFHFQQPDSPSPPPLPPPPNFSSRADFVAEGLRRSAPIVFQAPANHLDSLGQDPFEEAQRQLHRYGSALSEPLFDSAKSPRADIIGSIDLPDNGDASPPPRYANYDLLSSQPDFGHRGSRNNLQDLERITRYIQSLPDVPPGPADGDMFEHPGPTTDDEGDDDEPASPAAAPPPPAPPDPHPGEEQQVVSHEPTTGEKIFKALRAVTSQSYIDASEFYNSILTSAQQSQGFGSSADKLGDSQRSASDARLFSAYAPSEVARKACDLFSPELNQEAQRTAQQVYNSLQDPPASPLLLKDVDQQSYSYLSTDPSFTRTSEDIFNSLEHRRNKSVQERLNGFQELLELQESPESARQRNSLELLSALEEMQLRRRLSQLFDECREELQHDEHLLSSVSCNGALSRRGSLGPEPEPPPPAHHALSLFDDFASLQRAISCESVNSDTSVVLNDLEAGTEEAPVVGLICVALELDRWEWSSHLGETDLIVSVLEARDLIVSDGRPAQNTFARVCLLPDRQTHAKTRLYKGTNSPSYQEKFYFPLDGGTVGRTLLVEVFSYAMPDGESCISSGGESSLLGEASLRLGPALRPATTWLPLVSPLQPAPLLGELLFSLSYLPTAERLTLVIVKARNLKGANETPGDFFVKVYLLQQGKKLNKKRTTIKRGEKSPIFNEAIIFSVPSHALQNVQLRLTVAEVSGDLSASTKAYSVGHVIVGATTNGRSLAHWRQMLTMLRRPVPMWHPLRK